MAHLPPAAAFATEHWHPGRLALACPHAANHMSGPGVGDHPPRDQVGGLSPVLMLDPWNRCSCTTAAHSYLHHLKPQAESTEPCTRSRGLVFTIPAPPTLFTQTSETFCKPASQLLAQAADASSTNHARLDLGMPQPQPFPALEKQQLLPPSSRLGSSQHTLHLLSWLPQKDVARQRTLAITLAPPYSLLVSLPYCHASNVPQSTIDTAMRPPVYHKKSNKRTCRICGGTNIQTAIFSPANRRHVDLS